MWPRTYSNDMYMRPPVNVIRMIGPYMQCVFSAFRAGLFSFQLSRCNLIIKDKCYHQVGTGQKSDYGHHAKVNTVAVFDLLVLFFYFFAVVSVQLSISRPHPSTPPLSISFLSNCFTCLALFCPQKR